MSLFKIPNFVSRFTMTNTNTVTDIPVATKEVRSFRTSQITVISEAEQAGIVALASVKIKEPMFAVVEDDRNYIYSFSKLFEGIKKELDGVKERQKTTITFLTLSIMGFVGSLLFLKFNGNSATVDMIGYLSTVIIFFSLWDLTATRYKKMKKNLETKKTYILAESQVYLKNLEREVKKPVVVV